MNDVIERAMPGLGLLLLLFRRIFKDWLEKISILASLFLLIVPLMTIQEIILIPVLMIIIKTYGAYPVTKIALPRM
jgi:predicted membrane protein